MKAIIQFQFNFKFMKILFYYALRLLFNIITIIQVDLILKDNIYIVKMKLEIENSNFRDNLTNKIQSR